MLNVSNNNIITIDHGDDVRFILFINANTELEPLRYILENDDQLFFSVAEPNQDFCDAVVRKIFTKDDLNSFGDVVVEFDNSDTAKLLPGTYYYQAKLLVKKNGKDYIDTVVPSRKFCIM